LVAFAESPDGLALPERLVGALGRDLSTARRLPAKLSYLRSAADRYPSDPWLHYDLFETCRDIQPAEPYEALRHIAAACVLRPESAMFQLELGICCSGLQAYDLAVQAFRKSIAIYPNSVIAYRWMGLALANKNDEKGAMAAFEQALRLGPSDPMVIHSSTMGLMALGRPAEALQTIVDAFRQFPSWADNPRLYLRYNAACAALICASGKGSPPVPAAERQTYRQQALDLLAAELAVLAKLVATDREFVHQSLRQWSVDGDLEGVRPPLTTDLQPGERRGWESLWARVYSLKAATASAERSQLP
jgi:tetratricopeptide (TPR) repeat protein